FKNEWPVLLECASPAPDQLKLATLVQAADCSRMLILAEEHGVLGHLSACLHALDTNLVPLEVKQSLKEYQRAQIFFSLRMVVELFRLLDRFASEGIGALRVKGAGAFGSGLRRSRQAQLWRSRFSR